MVEAGQGWGFSGDVVPEEGSGEQLLQMAGPDGLIDALVGSAVEGDIGPAIETVRQATRHRFLRMEQAGQGKRVDARTV